MDHINNGELSIGMASDLAQAISGRLDRAWQALENMARTYRATEGRWSLETIDNFKLALVRVNKHLHLTIRLIDAVVLYTASEIINEVMGLEHNRFAMAYALAINMGDRLESEEWGLEAREA